MLFHNTHLRTRWTRRSARAQSFPLDAAIALNNMTISPDPCHSDTVTTPSDQRPAQARISRVRVDTWPRCRLHTAPSTGHARAYQQEKCSELIVNGFDRARGTPRQSCRLHPQQRSHATGSTGALPDPGPAPRVRVDVRLPVAGARATRAHTRDGPSALSLFIAAYSREFLALS